MNSLSELSTKIRIALATHAKVTINTPKPKPLWRALKRELPVCDVDETGSPRRQNETRDPCVRRALREGGIVKKTTLLTPLQVKEALIMWAQRSGLIALTEVVRCDVELRRDGSAAIRIAPPP